MLSDPGFKASANVDNHSVCMFYPGDIHSNFLTASKLLGGFDLTLLVTCSVQFCGHTNFQPFQHYRKLMNIGIHQSMQAVLFGSRNRYGRKLYLLFYQTCKLFYLSHYTLL